MLKRGLVLGGGGITGIAWEFGIIKAFKNAGIDLREADTVMGTSAGSVVGTLLLTHSEEELYERADRLSDPELGGRFSVPGMIMSAPLMIRPSKPAQRRAMIGRSAARAHPSGGHDRVELIRERIDVTEWPDADLRITATNCETGELTVFDRHSGVDIVHAVAASCAVPFVWSPVSINDTLYMDGGVRSPTNVDKLVGYDTLLVLAPIEVPMARYHNLHTALGRAGARRTKVLRPDAEARKVLGRNVLDPTRAAESVDAGEAQGERILAGIGSFWTDVDQAA